MSSQKNIQDELRSLGSNLPVSNNPLYSVPEGYFDGLAAAILAKVQSKEGDVQAELAALSPLLAGIPKQTPYFVPSFYFEKNAEEVVAIANDIESPVLATIGKALPYTVPDGYFEALPVQLTATVNKPKAKVVPLFARTWMRVASAAAVVGALFFGGYQLLSNSSNVEPVTIAKRIDTTEKNLVANNTQPVEKEIKKASTKDLEEFIEMSQVNTAKASGKTNVKDKGEVADLLKDVSVSEMESFLSALPTADDDLLITD